MKTSSLALLVVMPVLGFAAGRMTRSEDSPNFSEPETGKAISGGQGGSGSRSASSSHPAIASSDTSEALHSLPADQLYDRMALFLLDAKAEDFPAFFAQWQKREDRTNDLNDLLFINWTRVDPEAAIAAARGTEFERYSYWAWACHDPEKAFATAMERGEGQGPAIWGVAEFHPSWVLENWDRIPENERHTVFQALTKWPDTQTPEVTLRLLFEKGYDAGTFYHPSPSTLLAFARSNPTDAYKQILDWSGSSRSMNQVTLGTLLIQALSLHDPQLLGQIAETVTAPADRNRLELASFQSLLRDDPDAARAMIDEQPKSWLREDMAVAYANHLLAEDPAVGFDYAISLLNDDFRELTRMTEIARPNGMSRSGNSSTEVQNLVGRLVNQDPERVLNGLESTVPSDEYGMDQSPFRYASSLWASQDLESYSDWVVAHQNDDSIYREGATIIADQLRNQQEYAAAMEWAQSVPQPEGSPDWRLVNLYQQWRENDPEGALEWRQSEAFTGDPRQFPLPGDDADHGTIDE